MRTTGKAQSPCQVPLGIAGGRDGQPADPRRAWRQPGHRAVLLRVLLLRRDGPGAALDDGGVGAAPAGARPLHVCAELLGQRRQLVAARHVGEGRRHCGRAQARRFRAFQLVDQRRSQICLAHARVWGSGAARVPQKPEIHRPQLAHAHSRRRYWRRLRSSFQAALLLPHRGRAAPPKLTLGHVLQEALDEVAVVLG